MDCRGYSWRTTDVIACRIPSGGLVDNAIGGGASSTMSDALDVGRGSSGLVLTGSLVECGQRCGQRYMMAGAFATVLVLGCTTGSTRALNNGSLAGVGGKPSTKERHLDAAPPSSKSTQNRPSVGPQHVQALGCPPNVLTHKNSRPYALSTLTDLDQHHLTSNIWLEGPPETMEYNQLLWKSTQNQS